MYKLTDHLALVRDHYPTEQARYILESMMEGHTRAHVFVDDIQKPTISFVLEEGHSVFFGGVAATRDAYVEAIQYFKEHVLVDELKERLGILKLYPSTAEWDEMLFDSLGEYNPTRYWRSLYRHNLESLPTMTSDNLQVTAITGEIINNPTLHNLSPLVGEIQYMWGSTETFLSEAFGSCALQGDEVLGWCTGEYFSTSYCGIGIETIEAHQGRGIATLTATHFLHQCATRQLIPHWDSWKANTPSVKTAERVGFDKVLDYQIIFLKFFAG